MISKETKLNLKQERFCELYATDRQFFGNGVKAYIEAYNIDVSKKNAYAAARASASDLLTNPNILRHIDELLELGPLNEQFVDRQLAFLIEQNADYGTKMQAIKEFNALRQRITRKLALIDPRGEILNKYMGEADEQDSRKA